MPDPDTHNPSRAQIPSVHVARVGPGRDEVTRGRDRERGDRGERAREDPDAARAGPGGQGARKAMWQRRLCRHSLMMEGCCTRMCDLRKQMFTCLSLFLPPCSSTCIYYTRFNNLKFR